MREADTPIDIFVRIGSSYNITLEEWNHDQDYVHIMFRAHPNTEMSKFINDTHFGKPHFKSKKTGHCSYSTNNQKGSVRLEGNKVKDDANYPNFLRKAEKRLAQAQRKLSKRQKGSHNREKQRLRVAVLHEKIANQRREFLHKKTRYLVDHYDAIGIEDISVKAMAKYKKGGKFSFGKSVTNNGWNMFTNMLEYKLAWQGKQLIS